MRESGFTLLELLVAISIFSVLGLGGYQLLQSVSDSHDRVRTSIDSYIRVNQALTIMQRDFNQFVPRPIRDEYGEPVAPMSFDGQQYLVEFTRGGWSNPGGRTRSELQRVAYSIDYEEEILQRHFWLVLDRAEDSEPRSQVLLESVTDFRVMGFVDDSPERDPVDLEDNAGVMPAGVEVVIATEALGEVRRIFQLVDSYRPALPGNSEKDGGSEVESPESELLVDSLSEVRPGVER